MLLPDLSYLTPAQQEAVLDSPAIPPPDGITPDLVNPMNSNVLSLVITAFALAISSVVVFIRLYVSWVISKTFLLTDAIMVASFCLSVAFNAIVLDQTLQVGYLVHQWDVTLRDFLYVLKGFYITPTLFGLFIMLIKFSIILEWIRIFNPRRTKDLFFWASCAILTINVLFYIPAAFVFNLACRPWAKFHNPFIKGTCFDPTKVFIASGVINLMVDIAILLLPQRVIWSLRISGKKKIGIAAVFGVGLFSVVAAAIRLVWTIRVSTAEDVLYREAELGLWSTAEMTSALVLYCAPSMPKFIHNEMIRKLLSLPTAVGKSSCALSRLSRTGKDRQEGNMIPYQTLEGSDCIPLGAIQTPTPPPSAHLAGPQLNAPRQSNLRILRTTEIFTSQEGNAINSAETPTFQQYPWAGTHL